MAKSFQLDDWEVHTSANTLCRQDERVHIEPKMMNVLAYLADHAGQAISTEQLLIEFWRGTFYGDAPVQKCIAMLRKKLGDHPREPRYIETVQRRGYRIIAPVQFQDDRQRWTTAKPQERWTKGSPYLGLQSFQAEHAPIFFGCNKAIAEVIQKINFGLQEGFPYLLLIGKSGSGKSSLLRAGLIPYLTRAEGVAGIKVRDVRIVTPKFGREDEIFIQFFNALDEMNQLGEHWSYAVHGRQVIANPALLLGFLRNKNADNQPADSQLPVLLVIDQFEQLLLEDSVGPEDLLRLTALLKVLLQQGSVIVIVALRNDFYANAMESQGFAELKEEGFQYDLPAPGVADLARMIRLPALAAGLSFDEDPLTGQKLDEVLLQAAAGHADVLPLLEFTLELLYQRRNDDNKLLFSTYQSLGGLTGAIARQAEATFQSLSVPIQSCWDSVMHQLVTINSKTQALLAVQKVPLAQFMGDEQQAFIKQFVDARLFMMAGSDDPDQQQRCVTVAHETLLKDWPRVLEWAQRNREAILRRTQLAADCDRWQSEGRPADMLLLGSKKVKEASWIAQLPHLQLSETEQTFIRVSRQRHQRGKNYQMAAIVSLIMLSVSASGLALYANSQTVIAKHESQQANVLRQKAEDLLNFMLGDLRSQLEPIGKLDVLEGVGKKTLAYFTDLETPNRFSEASSLKLLAEININRGDEAQGKQQLLQALAILDGLHGQAAHTEDTKLLRSNLYYWLGLIAYQQSDFTTVLVQWQQYLQAAEQLLAIAPNKKQWKIEVSSARHNLGALALRMEDFPAAAAHFGASAAIERQILSNEPNSVEAQRALRGTLLWQSDVELNLLNIEAAKSLARAAISLARSYVESEPSNFGYKFELLSAYNVLINYQLLSKDWEALIQSFKQAMPLAHLLSMRDLGNESWNIRVATLLAHYFDYVLLAPEAKPEYQQLAEDLTARTYPKLQHGPSLQRLYAAKLLARRKNRSMLQMEMQLPPNSYHLEASHKYLAEWQLSCSATSCSAAPIQVVEHTNQSSNAIFARVYRHLQQGQLEEAVTLMTALAKQGVQNAHLQDVLEQLKQQNVRQGTQHGD